MTDLKSRVKNLDATSVALLMGFNKNDVSFEKNKEAREMINLSLISKFENGEIDEIELIIIEAGN